ncbi:hypothetical protein [Dactylosporangium sp. CA-233914]|uniref:hypothetical protein n=1 Tax=Dactylosporangium sp. CA-233914 TaxID=3239934 RepID=UPI003D8BD185
MAYRLWLTAIQVLLLTLAIRGLAWLLSAIGVPGSVCDPLAVAALAIGFFAAATAFMSSMALVAVGGRWGGGAGVDIAGQTEFTRMVLDDLRHPLSWPSRRYERW